MNESKLLYEEETFCIIGACFEVYKELGNGFLEAVYQEALAHEFNLRKIPFSSQPVIDIQYKDLLLNHIYKPDFICHDKIIIEIKTSNTITAEHRSQILNYLKATNLKVGLLVNFGHFPKLEHERFIM